MNAMIFDLQRNSFVDGPGIRTAVFFKGCNLRCKWCHNPESQKTEKQLMFYEDKCTNCNKCKEVCPNKTEHCSLCGKCAFYCPNEARQVCGKEYSVFDVLKEVVKDKIFYETSGGGVTFSGGECMLQIDFLAEILKKCKENGIHTAVDTAGNVPWEYFEMIMDYTDLFLYDVKCYSTSLHIEGTGVSNQLILNNLKKLSDNFVGDIFVRIPVITGFNTSVDEMVKIKSFIKELNIKKTELLPYHKMGEHKYKALNLPYNTYLPPSHEEMVEYNKIFND